MLYWMKGWPLLAGSVNARLEMKGAMEGQDSVRQALSRRINWVILLILGVFAVILTSSFLRAWRINQTLRNELRELEPLVTAALEEQKALKATLAYVQTDAYVESWAKGRARMTLPGETLVIPVFVEPTPTPTPVVLPPSPAPPTPEPPTSLLSRWWQTLLGR